MAFIRAKKRKTATGESTFYYVVQTYREEGRVHHQTLAYLGAYPTVEEALYGTVCDLHYQRRYWHLTHEQLALEASALTRVHPSELLIRWLKARRGTQARQLAHQFDSVQHELVERPQKITHLEYALARLRETAAVLGITNKEALVMPGTTRHREAQAKAEDRITLESRIFNRLAQGLKQEKETA